MRDARPLITDPVAVAIERAVAEAKQEGRRMVERAKEQTERDFAFFRRSFGQRFRWIRKQHSGGK